MDGNPKQVYFSPMFWPWTTPGGYSIMVSLYKISPPSVEIYNFTSPSGGDSSIEQPPKWRRDAEKVTVGTWKSSPSCWISDFLVFNFSPLFCHLHSNNLHVLMSSSARRGPRRLRARWLRRALPPRRGHGDRLQVGLIQWICSL